MHTVGGTCAHALSVFCLPAFVHCINIQKSTRYRALPSDEIEKKWDLEFITVWCKEFGGWKESLRLCVSAFSYNNNLPLNSYLLFPNHQIKLNVCSICTQLRMFHYFCKLNASDI